MNDFTVLVFLVKQKLLLINEATDKAPKWCEIQVKTTDIENYCTVCSPTLHVTYLRTYGRTYTEDVCNTCTRCKLVSDRDFDMVAAFVVLERQSSQKVTGVLEHNPIKGSRFGFHGSTRLVSYKRSRVDN